MAEEKMPAVACTGTTSSACGALGWALRRASEAERLVERLRDELAQTRAQACVEVLDRPSIAAPPQLSGCPKCGSDKSSVRGLRKEETERGLRVCSRCFTKYGV